MASLELGLFDATRKSVLPRDEAERRFVETLGRLPARDHNELGRFAPEALCDALDVPDLERLHTHLRLVDGIPFSPAAASHQAVMKAKKRLLRPLADALVGDNDAADAVLSARLNARSGDTPPPMSEAQQRRFEELYAVDLRAIDGRGVLVPG